MTRNREREDAVIEARMAGESFRSIAKRLGISYGRVSQIWQRSRRELAESKWRSDLAQINSEIGSE